MSLLQFSDTTNKNGIVQVIRRRVGTSASTTSYPIEDITVDVNMALARFFVIANTAAGKWQPVDDTTHADFPVVYANVATGVQDIVLTLDEQGNQILEILKVILTRPDGTKKILRQVDINDEDNAFLVDSTTGIPETYELTANGIFLHQTPNFTLASALEVWVSRGAKYFAPTDDTKRAGIPEVFGEYLTLRPSYFKCLQAGDTAKAQAYGLELFGHNGRGGMEADIANFYAQRNRSERKRLTVTQNSTR